MQNKKNTRKIKKEQIRSLIIVLIILLICVIIAISSIIPSIKIKEKSKKQNETNEFKWSTDEELKEKERDELKNMTEKDRIKTYLSKYISYIEEENFEKAYSLLYEEFRNNNFENIEFFKNYIKRYYPKMILVDYDNIQRQGKYFIIYTTISGLSEEGYSVKLDQSFVIYEKGYDDFVLSFSIN